MLKLGLGYHYMGVSMSWLTLIYQIKNYFKSTEKLKEYQEDSINIINNIANNYIESQKELFTYFSDSYTGNNTNRVRNYPQTSWLNYYSPEKFAQIYGENVNTFNNSLLRYGNLLNNLTIANINYFKSFLQQMELYSKEFHKKKENAENIINQILTRYLSLNFIIYFNIIEAK